LVLPSLKTSFWPSFRYSGCFTNLNNNRKMEKIKPQKVTPQQKIFSALLIIQDFLDNVNASNNGWFGRWVAEEERNVFGGYR
jgi:hypothetical protein